MPGKQGPGKSLAEQIAELEDPTPKDFDPENPDDRGQSSEEESDQDDASAAGREHYEAVSESKLRKPEPVDLGREYTGSRISRDALYGDAVDDEALRSQSSDASAGSDEDETESGIGSEEERIYSKNDMEDGDIPKPKRERSKRDALNVPDEPDMDMDDLGSNDESESDDAGEDGEAQASTDESEEEDESEAEDSKKEPKNPSLGDREELRRLMASDHKTVAASISQASKADAAKGLAVKRQRSAFDALLNTRIKLQKGLTAAGELSLATDDADSLDGNVVKSAESAALTLWNTLDELRHALADSQSTQASSSSKKRKRIPAPTAETVSSDIWMQMREFETECFAHRRAVLDKWARKTRSSKAVAPNARGKLLNTGGDQQSLTAVLDAHAAAESESYGPPSKRPKSGGNPQDSNEVNTNSGIATAALYDDTIFYNSLLRDLVEQRMSSANGGMTADNLHLQIPTRLSINPVSGMRKDKVKRVVDAKASKGRKMRYTVHEKLQNFMAAEERGSWSDRAREELFASLLGNSASVMLGEDEEDEEELRDGAEVEDEDLEAGGLRLFRS